MSDIIGLAIEALDDAYRADQIATRTEYRITAEMHADLEHGARRALAARTREPLLARAVIDQEKEIERLRVELNTPQIANFVEAVRIEAAHQRERWGDDHDAGKRPEDWIALIAYLLGKATKAHYETNVEKLLHHVITIAAACVNWHANATGHDTRMPPGLTPNDDESRCASCGWPLVDNLSEGCVRGNCSQRPRPEKLYAPDRAAREVKP